jgi:hypothetical protein
MNRNFTLILSTILVVVLLGIWIYLMFFADSASQDEETITESGEFAEFDSLQGGDLGDGSVMNGSGEFGFEDEDGVGRTVPGEGGEWPILRQLTTRNVIGYQEVEIASTTSILFMESGVGHVYHIDLETGVETRVSATTIPDARRAVFSRNGEFVVVKTGEDTGPNPLWFGVLDRESRTVELVEIAEGVGSFTITPNDEVLYTTTTNNSAVASVFMVETQTSEILFSTPFREAVVLFGESVNANHYFLPRTSHLLEGFMYEVIGNTFNRLPLDGFGFTSTLVNTHLISSYRDQSALVSTQYNTETGEIAELATPVIPDKCVSSTDKLFCAQPDNRKLQYNSINRWLQGMESYADSLWVLDKEPEMLINITSFSGREVDVINGLVGKLSGDWYFQNKKDQTLWIYELSRLPKEEVIEENI